MPSALRSPFPWHGGKSAIAPAIWARLGDTPNYVEPFAGSAAVLLARPHDLEGKTETINDADSLVENAWRAITYATEETAFYCDRIVSEASLTAAHLHLKAARDELTSRVCADPFYCDPALAGLWLFGIASWIGGGWCVADGPWIAVDGRLVDRRTIGSEEEGVKKQMPIVGAGNHGASGHNGVNAERYRAGVPKQMPMVASPGEGRTGHNVGVSAYTTPAALLAYFARLSDRLRRVRILCGDWRRVVKPSITVNHGLSAVLLDPPYPSAEHDMRYHGDNDIWHQAAALAIENGDNPKLRICVCGYWSEQTDALFPPTWERLRWEARGGYANQSADGRGRANAKREVIFFSPHCIDAATDYGPLFEELA